MHTIEYSSVRTICLNHGKVGKVGRCDQQTLLSGRQICIVESNCDLRNRMYTRLAHGGEIENKITNKQK